MRNSSKFMEKLKSLVTKAMQIKPMKFPLLHLFIQDGLARMATQPHVAQDGLKLKTHLPQPLECCS